MDIKLKRNITCFEILKIWQSYLKVNAYAIVAQRETPIISNSQRDDYRKINPT